MTIFVKPVGADLQFPVSKVTVAGLERFFFYKKGICPILSHFFLASKHSKTLSKTSPNSTKILNQIQTSQALIPDSRLNLKLQFSIPIFIKNSPKLRYVGWLWKPSFPQVQPFILYIYFKFMGPYDYLWTLELWNYYYTSYYGLFLHIIMKWNYYVMFMVFMLPWSNYEGWYIYMYVVGGLIYMDFGIGWT